MALDQDGLAQELAYTPIGEARSTLKLESRMAMVCSRGPKRPHKHYDLTDHDL